MKNYDDVKAAICLFAGVMFATTFAILIVPEPPLEHKHFRVQDRCIPDDMEWKDATKAIECMDREIAALDYK